jgi:acetolactate synthase-1/2/3 large subunit
MKTTQQEATEISTSETKQISGSIALLEALVAEGVDTFFGVPGGANIAIYDALYYYSEKLEHILVRHEQGAIHAAQGYARTSGKVGVALATSGPGATNMITGIADAMIDSTPGFALPVRFMHIFWGLTPSRKRISSISPVR